MGIIALAAACAPPVGPEDKSAFLKLMQELPHQGEFFTDTAVDKAAGSTAVLFSLTSQDLAGRDLYLFLALSRGLCDREGPMKYAARHFGEIAHPEIQMAWAVMLFDKGNPSREVVHYLDAALNSQERARKLAEFVGPEFSTFKERVKAAQVKNGA